jgi:hypothetical protein
MLQMFGEMGCFLSEWLLLASDVHLFVCKAVYDLACQLIHKFHGSSSWIILGRAWKYVKCFVGQFTLL